MLKKSGKNLPPKNKISYNFCMETSIYLARVIGLVSVISTVAIMIRYKHSLFLEAETLKYPSNIYQSGFVILLLGILIIVSHPVWALDWRLAITLVGWLLLLKGVGRIFFPDAVSNLVEKKKNNRKFILGEVAVFIMGLYLLYHGFIVY